MPEAATATPAAPQTHIPQGQLPLEPAMPTAIAPSGQPRRFEMREEPETVAAPAAPAEGADGVQNTGDEAPPATPEAKPEVEDTPEQAAKREGRRFGRKLDKAYRERAEAQARADFAEKRLAELNQPKAPEGAPTLEQFDYDPEKYANAKAEFAKSQTQKEIEAKQREEHAKREHAQILSGWEEKAAKADDKYDDFTEIVGDLKPTNPLIAAIMEADNGADIAYYLGKNAKEAQRITSLPLRSQLREIGKLEAKLLAQVEKPKTPSKAPAPITPLTGAAPVVSDTPTEQDDTAEWIRKRSKQVHGNRRF